MRRYVRWGGALLGTAALAAGARGASLAAGMKTATFTVTTVHTTPEANVTIHSKVWVTPTQARADIDNPLEGKHQVLVTSGYWYELDPMRKRGGRTPLPKQMVKSTDNFSQLIGRFAFDASDSLKAAKKVRTEAVSGYQCDVFNVSDSKGGDSLSVTVWVPQKMDPSFPIKAVREARSEVKKPGATINQVENVSMTLSDLQLGKAIPSSTFAVPTGYKITTLPAPGTKGGQGAPGSKALPGGATRKGRK